MNKEEFIKTIEEVQEQERQIDKLDEIGIDIFRFPLINYCYQLFAKLLNIYFTEEGVDWIYWWLLEKNGDPEIKAWDENKNEIPTETIEDLWNLVKEYHV